MADLQALIRLRKYRVEEKQKILADLFREAEKIEARRADLLAQVATEQKIAQESDTFETHTAFTLFAERVRSEIELIDQALVKLNLRIGIAQDAMREAFGEMKKIEIIQERRDEAEIRDLLKREGQDLDEVALEVFRRKEE